MTNSSNRTGPRVFLSYKRNSEPDQSLVAAARQSLLDSGSEVLIDQSIRVGEPWAEEIERQVRASDFLVVFLSEKSSHSEMVKGEVEIALDEASKSNGRPRILPVRVGYTARLPYPLNAYLDRIQYAMWQDAGDTAAVMQALLLAIGGGTLPHQVDDGVAKQVSAIPTYAAHLPPPGGTLDVEDDFYIPRDPDARVAALMAQAGNTVVIKGPRQMGKSSLLVRMLAAAAATGKRMAVLDFQLLDQVSRTDRNFFFRSFAKEVSNAFEVEDVVDGHWDEGTSNTQNCTRYMERHVLAKVATNVTLAIDEADSVFGTEYRDDFFGMIRAWHNLRGNPAKRLLWRKLDLLLVTSTEPFMFIDRPVQSPWNVGLSFKLEGFKEHEVERLNALHGSCLAAADVSRLHRLLAGHPYLTRKAFYVACSSDREFSHDNLFDRAQDDDGPFGDHLKYYLLRIREDPQLNNALLAIVNDRGCDDVVMFYRLEGAGLVKRTTEGRVVPRCELYRDYFKSRLVLRD